ncbi:ParA family protein [Erwinia papayae]|uniref:ParA family protein n=1 Tax=Erwinia papayae TaxID=206499 RepID=A0ABV3MYH6_9GAMM
MHSKTKVVPIVSTKGGEGKSTQTAYLGGFLADAGIKTLIIDGDHAQPTLSSMYPLSYEAPCGLYELLMQTVDLSSPENIISRTNIDNLDLIVSNDPRNLLPTYMLNVADGRVRLRNALSTSLFSQYDVILIDSQGCRSVMFELIILASTGDMIGMVKPALADIREFLRGTVALMEDLLPYTAFGINLPRIHMLINCMKYTVLAQSTVEEAEHIVSHRKYSQHADKIHIKMLKTRIYDLDIYLQGHASGKPVHRLERKTTRASDSAFDSMYQLACELFPEWKSQFDALNVAGESHD